MAKPVNTKPYTIPQSVNLRNIVQRQIKNNRVEKALHGRGTTTQTVNAGSNKKEDELSVEELLKREELGMEISEADEKRLQEHHDKENKAAEAKKKRQKLKGELLSNLDDPDEGDPEKSKFDIQQGDIIEFLMKEVVIASAAWAGDKAFGYAGLWTYRSLRWGYRNIGKPIGNGLKEGVKGGLEELNEVRTQAWKSIKDATVDRRSFELKPNDDETTRFGKELYAINQKKIDNLSEIENNEDLRKAVANAMDGKLDEVVIHDKKGHALQPDHPLVQTLVKLSKKAVGNFPPAEAQEAIATTIADMAVNAAKIQTIAGNYAVAKLIEEKSKNPKRFEGIKTDSLYKMYYNNGYKIALIEGRNIIRGNGTYSNTDAFLKDSTEALHEARDNILDKNYLDKDGRGHHPQTPKLDKIHGIYLSASTPLRVKNIEKLQKMSLAEEVLRTTADDERYSSAHEEAQRQVNYYDSQISNNALRRTLRTAADTRRPQALNRRTEYVNRYQQGGR